MLESVDAELASSYVITVISVALVGGLAVQYLQIHPEGIRYGTTIAGLIFVCYGVVAMVYTLLK